MGPMGRLEGKGRRSVNVGFAESSGRRFVYTALECRESFVFI